MPLDAFGLPQPSPVSRVLLGARYAPVTTVVATPGALYLEVPSVGALWQPGLPMPLRDNRSNLPLMSPGVLGLTSRIEVLLWGSLEADGVNFPAVQCRLGPDLLATVTSTGAAELPLVWAISLVANPTVNMNTLIVTHVSTIGAVVLASRSTITLTTGADVVQTLAIVGVGVGARNCRIDAAEVWLVSALGFPPAESLVG